MEDKLKIVWLCHFSNKKVRDKLSLNTNYFSNKILKFLGKNKPKQYNDFAPWITKLISEFEKFQNIELHVIAPHYGMQNFNREFEINGIFYHFYKPELPFHIQGIINSIFKLNSSKYRLNRFFVKKIIKKINPDIINLIGAENPYYSITTLDIKNKPVFVTAQTVYTNPERKKYGEVDVHRWDIELRIHRKENYFGCGGRMHHDLILNNNPNAIIFKFFFPINAPQRINGIEKKYDFVFFAAQVNQKKGVEDAINALAIVKSQFESVTLNIIGQCEPIYLEELIHLTKKLGLCDNVIFSGFYASHQEMYENIQKSKFALLPIKLDVISSTVIEAMILELPVVTNITSGTPFLNNDKQTVLLSEIDDVKSMAENMMKLMKNPEFADQIKNEAKLFVNKEFDNEISAKRLLSSYKAVLNHYHQNIPIPKELLFDLNEFKKY